MGLLWEETMNQHRVGARFLIESGLGYLIFEPCELFSIRQNETDYWGESLSPAQSCHGGSSES